MKLYWLSFCDAARPRGQQFLGVSIVEVDDADVSDAAGLVSAKFGERPHEAYEIAAATRKAWATGCNPGGEVGSVDITDGADRVPVSARHVLLSRQRLKELGLTS